MAISKQLKDEADRTIAGISAYYDKFGDASLDAEEREHRIRKVEAALEGCNGLTEKEKIQKTAENLFGLTCSWERDSLALRRELIINREKIMKSFETSKAETTEEFTKLGSTVAELGTKMDTIASDLVVLAKEFKEHSTLSTPATFPQLPPPDALPTPTKPTQTWHYKLLTIIDNHFGVFVISIITLLLLLILSGNLEWIGTFIDKKP